MTGNDIIDLATAAVENNWKRIGFLEKVFTRQEQHEIREAAQPGEMVWKLWSMKESAYKVYTRTYGGRFFTPQKCKCSILTATTGKVVIHNNSYDTITSADKNYIYTIAIPEETVNTSFISCCFRIYQDAHCKMQQIIYHNIITHYAMITGKEKKEMMVIKDRNGIPFLRCRQDDLNIPLSITHHGEYAAFTIY